MNFFQNISLKYKLVLLILSVTLLSLIIGFTINIFREYETLKEKMLNESIMNAKLVSEYCITPLDFGYQDEAEENLSKLETIPAILYACVYDVHGTPFASYSKVDTVNAPPIPDDDSYYMFGSEWLHVFRTIKFNDEKKGTIYLRVSTAELSEGLENHLISIVIISLGMMIIAYLLAIGMQRLISQPILTLADITERISQKADYTVQIERNSSDEIGTLYRSFNKMLEQIHFREMERDEAEEEKTRLTGILENTSDLVSMAKPDASLLYVNRAGRSMLGWTAEENIKNKTIPKIHPDWAYKIIDEEGIPAAIKSGVWDGETAIIGTEGKEIPVLQVIISHKSPDGSLKFLSTIMRDISERKQAEEALRASQAFNETLLNTSPDIIYIYDIDEQKNVYTNSGITNVLGYSVEDVQAMGENLISQIMHPDEFKVYIKETIPRYQTAKDGEIIEHEYRMRHKDGTWRWLYSKESIFIRKDDGTPVQIFGVVSDVTQRKRAEKALQESENRYRHIVESSLSGMHMYELKENNRLVFTGANPAADRIMGVDNSIFIGKTIEEAFPPLSETEVPEKYRLAAANGDTWSTEQIMYEEGTVSGAFEVFAFQTEPNKMVAMFHDITERKKAEEELRHLRSYLSNIIDSMPSVLAGVDADGRVTQWNKTAEQTTGISAETAHGKLLSDVFPHMSSEMEKITESIRTRQIKQEQKRPRAAENGVLFEDITIYPLISNGAQGAVIRIDDVTDKVRMEEMMIQSEKMLSVGGLAAGMAHEINNPLAGMIQTASVMSDRLTNIEMSANIRAAEEAGISMDSIKSFMEKRKIINMLGRIRESGSRAAEIVTNMLSFARKGEASFSTRDLAELFDQTVDLAGSDYDLKKKFDFRQLEIIRDYDENLPAVQCEAGKIQQVLLNILRNSAEALYEEAADGNWKMKGKPRLELRLIHDKDEGYVRIEINDNGPGMNEDVRKRIFEPFFTTKPTDQGTGLGLSVSYFIITENHGGEMSVESAPGEGTKFIIRLPLERRQL